MKNLITSFACLILLLAVLLQFVQFQVLFLHILRCEDAADSLFEEVRKEGCVTESAERAFRKQVQKELSCDEKEITVQGASQREEEGALIPVRVSFPLKNLVLAPAFWGIREEKNQENFVIRRCIVSEYLEEIPKEEASGNVKEVKGESDAEGASL
ncbi:MAG: hypothetical protein PUC44_03510 [Eubacteriales bacterium]|nr:hypothetical protein [Eubacteriales bacterium]